MPHFSSARAKIEVLMRKAKRMNVFLWIIPLSQSPCHSDTLHILSAENALHPPTDTDERKEAKGNLQTTECEGNIEIRTIVPGRNIARKVRR